MMFGDWKVKSTQLKYLTLNVELFRKTFLFCVDTIVEVHLLTDRVSGLLRDGVIPVCLYVSTEGVNSVPSRFMTW